MRILVVDDEQPTRDFFLRVLTPPEFQVVTASNGADAVELLKACPCSLAFVDIVMPGMDGLETLKSLLKVQPQLPVIMMTGYAVEDNVILALHLGAIDVVYKPFEDDNHVLTAIQQFQKRQQLKPLNEKDKPA